MSSIVGLNDDSDESNQWLRVCRDVEDLCRWKPRQIYTGAEAVLRSRAQKEVGEQQPDGIGFVGREGAQEQRVLRRIQRVQALAAGGVQQERHAQAQMFESRPQKLVVPSRTPRNMFQARKATVVKSDFAGTQPAGTTTTPTSSSRPTSQTPGRPCSCSCTPSLWKRRWKSTRCASTAAFASHAPHPVGRSRVPGTVLRPHDDLVLQGGARNLAARASYRAGKARDFEDGFAASTFAGAFGDPSPRFSMFLAMEKCLTANGHHRGSNPA